MKASGTRGAIVNVTSAAGLRGGLGPAAYTSSKAGVIALTQQAACECAPHGIRVNSVAPAYVSTVCTYASYGRPSWHTCRGPGRPSAKMLSCALTDDGQYDGVIVGLA